MTEKRKSILDGLGEGIRQVLKDLERMLNPEPQPQPVRVPVPVRPRGPQRPPQRDQRY